MDRVSNKKSWALSSENEEGEASLAADSVIMFFQIGLPVVTLFLKMKY